MSLQVASTPAQKRLADQALENVDRLARQAEAADKPGYTVRNLSQVRPERIEWLWPGHLPKGKSIVLDGDPGQGKSTVADDIAARVTTGSPWPDGSPGCSPANVILMSAEDGLADTILPRINAAGGDTSRIFALESVSGEDGSPMPPMLPGSLPVIERAIAEHDAALLVVDVLMSYLDGSVNSYKDQDVRAKVMTPLTSMLKRTGCTALLLRHLNKGIGGNAISRGGGSIGIVGAARAAFVIAQDKEDDTRHVMAPEKFNLGVMPKSLAYTLVPDSANGCARVQWLGETDDTADALLNIPPETQEEKDDRSTVQSFLVSYLETQGGDASASDVLKAGRAAGFDDSQIKNARHRCRDPRIVSRKSGGTGFGWVWAIEPTPKGVTEASRPLYSRNVTPLTPLSVSNGSAMTPLTQNTKGVTARDMTSLPNPARPLDLSSFDASQLDGLAHSWAKQLERDGMHSIDATLARMTPESLELLNQRGGVLKTATDLEYQRRSGIPVLTA
jgi:RecA-family ATPase